MTGRHGNQLEHWIIAAEGDTLPPLASFARNLRRDQKAVHNGLSLPYSSGPVEGTINRLKMLKRQMFGRAGLVSRVRLCGSGVLYGPEQEVLTMSRPPAMSVEDKQRIVLSVLSGEMTLADAARRNKVSEQSVSRWKSQFLEAGRAGLAEGGKSGPSSREQQLQAEIDELTTALGEAHVQLRVWKRSAEHQLGPSRTLR